MFAPKESPATCFYLADPEEYFLLLAAPKTFCCTGGKFLGNIIRITFSSRLQISQPDIFFSPFPWSETCMVTCHPYCSKMRLKIAVLLCWIKYQRSLWIKQQGYFLVWKGQNSSVDQRGYIDSPASADTHAHACALSYTTFVSSPNLSSASSFILCLIKNKKLCLVFPQLTLLFFGCRGTWAWVDICSTQKHGLTHRQPRSPHCSPFTSHRQTSGNFYPRFWRRVHSGAQESARDHTHRPCAVGFGASHVQKSPLSAHTRHMCTLARSPWPCSLNLASGEQTALMALAFMTSPKKKKISRAVTNLMSRHINSANTYNTWKWLKANATLGSKKDGLSVHISHWLQEQPESFYTPRFKCNKVHVH